MCSRTAWIVGELHHLLDECLAALVGWMGLACDDDLDRPLLVGQQRLQPSRIAQHQGSTACTTAPAGQSRT